jgi:hypothetical protein
MLGPNYYKALRKYCQLVVRYARSNLTRGKKNVTKNLYNSITFDINNTTGDVSFFFLAPAEIYGWVVERGRRKGAKAPPQDAIFDWIKRRGLKGRDKKGRFISDRSLAFVIGRSISKKGIAPFPFLQRAIKQADKQGSKMMAEGIAKDTQQKLIDAIKKG